MVTLRLEYFLTSLAVSSSVRNEFMRTRGTSVLYVLFTSSVNIMMAVYTNLFRCSSCCTVRSRVVRSFLTGIVHVGPLQSVSMQK